MRIPLSEFNLPGTPGIDGNVTYSAITYDINSGKEVDGHTSYNYFVCGWREDDGAGVLIHGTPNSDSTRYDWRVPRTICAPSDTERGLTVTKTEFHGVESLDGPYVRLVGRVVTEENPNEHTGFLYEGPLDGSGDWYPICTDSGESVIVKASDNDILICDPDDGTDSVLVFSLQTQTWSEIHSGYAGAWDVDDIIRTPDIVVIRLLHSDGKRSDLVHKTAQ